MNFNFTLTENQKKVIIALGVVVATLGFANIAGLISQFPQDLEVIITAVSSAISVITAYYKKVEDVIKNPKGEEETEND